DYVDENENFIKQMNKPSTKASSLVATVKGISDSIKIPNPPIPRFSTI
ncbi:16866_t:CDS:2, partial [Entrophospora sp. SA101]